MPCLPCGGPPSDSKLLARCYPPTKQLQSSSNTQIQPLKDELHELVVRLRETGQASRVVSDIERRVQKDTAKTSSPVTTQRTSLLISLSILGTITREFRTGIPSFAKSIIRILNVSIDYATSKHETDLDCLARSISLFIAFSNHSTGTDIHSNTQSFSAYLLVIRKFAAIATWVPSTEKPDLALKNRTRAYGLSGIYAALNSSLLLGQAGEGDEDKDFGKQVRIIVPPLLINVMESDIHTLKTESAQVERSGDRRAPSIRGYGSDEKAPDTTAVLRLALKSIYDLVAQCQTAQLSTLVDALFDHLDKAGWQDIEMCCWIAERLTSGAMLQYRYVIPTRLVELIVGMGDIAPGHKQTTILAMIMTVINSDISLVGLGVIYILDSLVGLTIRRIRCNVEDALLPALVQCIASLAMHIYYPEQVNEIVEEIAYRIPDIPSSDAGRPYIVRILVCCMIGVMETAQRGDELEQRLSGQGKPTADKGKGPQLREGPARPKQSKRRAAISPDIWQETLPLLCESTYAVRAAYARALILYIEQELPREDDSQVGLGDTAAYRFCNALHATVYTLAMSCSLGTGSPPPSNIASPFKQSPSNTSTPLPPPEPVDPKSSSPPDLNEVDRQISKQVEKERTDRPEKGVSFNVTELTPLDTPTGTVPGNGTSTPPRKSSRSSRRVSLPLARMTSFANIESFDNVATPYDYASILKIMEVVHRAVPLAALSSGIPMLLALDADAGNELIRRPGDGRSGAWVLERRRAIRETVVFTWKKIGQQWDLSQVESLANKTLDNMPEPWLVPTYQPLAEPTILPPPDQTCQFIPHEMEGESSSASRPIINRDEILSILANSPSIQHRSGRDEMGLIKRLGASWSVENALKNCMSSSLEKLMKSDRENINLTGQRGEFPTFHFLFQPLSPSTSIKGCRCKRSPAGSGISTNTSRAPSLRSSSFRSPSRSQVHLGSAASGSDRPRSRLSSPIRVQGNGVGVKEVLKDIFQNRQKENDVGDAHHQPEPASNGVVPIASSGISNGDGMEHGLTPKPVTQTAQGNRDPPIIASQ